ncbi:MAG: N(4)-(beta-N-acetylglucosaminyl)-L-asparaginase [Planctomycetes bacterium]|nr:N(4)-(beta-N-acetylglucosaminyl)-L-asparaginase [Planctomycetota bacterium]
MLAIASHNGKKATSAAFDLLQQKRPALEAVVEGASRVEDDPQELTVGYGGLPNEDGVVELDAAVMDGPTHRGGAVAAMRNIRHATRVARLVMEQTDRVLLAGEGALRFALANGFARENLLTDKSRRMWLHWKRSRSEHDDWITPEEDDADLDLQANFEKQFYRPSGTVHVAALDHNGDLACATSTSGHAFKMAGRVGDSPILGAGLYVDNAVGTCGSIGHGEANLENCSSFLGVELMRTGRSPEEAGLEVLRRVAANARPRQRDEQGRPKFNLQLFLLDRDGRHAGVAIWDRRQYALSDADGTRLENCTPLYVRSN